MISVEIVLNVTADVIEFTKKIGHVLVHDRWTLCNDIETSLRLCISSTVVLGFEFVFSVMIASYAGPEEPLASFRGCFFRRSRNPFFWRAALRAHGELSTPGGGLGMESGEELLTDVAARDEAVDSSVRRTPAEGGFEDITLSITLFGRQVPGSSIVPLVRELASFPPPRVDGSQR
jgi:hypothetical protein